MLLREFQILPAPSYLICSYDSYCRIGHPRVEHPSVSSDLTDFEAQYLRIGGEFRTKLFFALKNTKLSVNDKRVGPNRTHTFWMAGGRSRTRKHGFFLISRPRKWIFRKLFHLNYQLATLYNRANFYQNRPINKKVRKIWPRKKKVKPIPDLTSSEKITYSLSH